jgi:hypothetical protein
MCGVLREGKATMSLRTRKSNNLLAEIEGFISNPVNIYIKFHSNNECSIFHESHFPKRDIAEPRIDYTLSPRAEMLSLKVSLLVNNVTVR